MDGMYALAVPLFFSAIVPRNGHNQKSFHVKIYQIIRHVRISIEMTLGDMISTDIKTPVTTTVAFYSY